MTKMIKLSTLLKAKEITEIYATIKNCISNIDGKVKSPTSSYNVGIYNIYGYAPNQVNTSGLMALPNEVLKKLLTAYLKDLEKDMEDLGVEIDI